MTSIRTGSRADRQRPHRVEAELGAESARALAGTRPERGDFRELLVVASLESADEGRLKCRWSSRSRRRDLVVEVMSLSGAVPDRALVQSGRGADQPGSEAHETLVDSEPFLELFVFEAEGEVFVSELVSQLESSSWK